MTTALRINPETGHLTHLAETTLWYENFREADLEAWLCEHPELIDEDLFIVARQAGRWASETGTTSSQRIDILAIDRMGAPVVMEAKRGACSYSLVQAVTYVSLVEGCQLEDLAAMHRIWMRGRGIQLSKTDAIDRIRAHIGEGVELLSPRVLLIAEAYPAAAFSAFRYLAKQTPGIPINAYAIRSVADEREVTVWADRVWPLSDASAWKLGPDVHVTEESPDRVRRSRSVAVIAERRLIPAGATLELYVNGPNHQVVEQWLDADPVRSNVTWTGDALRPLQWNGQTWTASGLAQHMISAATGAPSRVSGPDVWWFGEHSLYGVAARAEEAGSACAAS